jgi:hypothetical protein
MARIEFEEDGKNIKESRKMVDRKRSLSGSPIPSIRAAMKKESRPGWDEFNKNVVGKWINGEVNVLKLEYHD